MTQKPPTKVLMIDDEKLLLDIYRIKFESSGYEVYTCYSVDEGLAILRTGYTPDVMLVDINMPEKSGFEFLEAVQREKLRKHALVVALTNEGQDGEKERMAELGTDALLMKADYLPREIVDAVQALLVKKQAQ